MDTNTNASISKQIYRRIRIISQKNQNCSPWQMSFSLIYSIDELSKEDFINNEDPNLAVGKPWFVCLPSPLSHTIEAFPTTQSELRWTCSSLPEIQAPYTPWKRLRSAIHSEPQQCLLGIKQRHVCVHCMQRDTRLCKCYPGTRRAYRIRHP